MKRRILVALILAGSLASLFATDVRTISMGRSDYFYMDEMSVFYNPANIGIYPNMLIGSIGKFGNTQESDSLAKEGIFANHDPQSPYFGGFLSYSLGQSQEGGSQYPMISIGAMFNREDDLLGKLDPSDKINFIGENFSSDYSGNRNVNYLDPVGKVDIMTGLALKNGTMLGAGCYFAFQNSDDQPNNKHQGMSLLKGSVGLNSPVSKTIDLEVSADVALFSMTGWANDTMINLSPVSGDSVVIAQNDVYFRGDVRVFSGLSSINGDFVPHIGFNYMSFNQGTHNILGFDGGLGLNINIDRGFFWTGLKGAFEKNDHRYVVSDSVGSYETTNEISGTVSFGIERNVLWDWFVIRAGGSKKLIYRKIGGESGKTIWSENPGGTGGDDDLLGIGIGINIENRLKIDAVMAEDILYTFTNLFSGKQGHLFNRISATFSF